MENNKKDTRTLQLTHDEIYLILRALGIAENSFSKKRIDYIDNVIRVRGSINDYRKEADFMLDLADKFASLNIDIESGLKDI